MVTQNLSALREKVEAFEEFLDSALRQKYQLLGTPPDITDHLIQGSTTKTWDLLEFCDKYRESAAYPSERLSRLVHQLFDIKLQFYYLEEVDSGLYNRVVYDRGYDQASPGKLPHVLLTRFSFDQNLIGKSRVLWERTMNFLFYLETGKELERSSRGSKRSAFFRLVQTHLKWRFLEPYGSLLEQYDKSFRTPEFHGGSVLRKEVFGESGVDPNALLELLNKAMNNLWPNLLSIISGGKAVSFNELHIRGDLHGEFELDPKYLQEDPMQ